MQMSSLPCGMSREIYLWFWHPWCNADNSDRKWGKARGGRGERRKVKSKEPCRIMDAAVSGIGEEGGGRQGKGWEARQAWVATMQKKPLFFLPLVPVEGNQSYSLPVPLCWAPNEGNSMSLPSSSLKINDNFFLNPLSDFISHESSVQTTIQLCD